MSQNERAIEPNNSQPEGTQLGNVKPGNDELNGNQNACASDRHNSNTLDSVIVGGGEMGAAIRAFDWSVTPLGAIETWSQSLQTVVNVCLNSRFPMVIWWGQDLVLLYNDAWQPILGSKHPHALGKPGQTVWTEIWDIIGAQLTSALTTGQATWSNDLLLPVDRHGYQEEAYFTYSYSPIFLEDGTVGGAFTAVTETTERVLGERRLATLQHLAAQAGQAKTVEEAYSTAIQILSDNPKDIPFAVLYSIEAAGTQAQLRGCSASIAGTLASPHCVDLTTEAEPSWSLATVLQTGNGLQIEDVMQRFGALPVGDWAIPPQQALVLPLRAAGQETIVGTVIVGVSAGRVLDEDYRNFFDLVAGQIATAIANARAYEEERLRAEALAELDRAKTTFFSNVSHEFRTPLTLILAPLQDALASLPDEEEGSDQAMNVSLPISSSSLKEQLQLAHRNSLRLLKLVNTLLDFSRIEAGRIQAVYEPTDLAVLTTELTSAFQSTIERAGLRLMLRCDPLPEPVYVDREMWEKIVFNLLSNAFKFTFDGEIRVSLRWEDGNNRRDQEERELADLPSSSYAILEVEDTGTGIPAAELPHLFERFHRVQGARARTYEGSGIGLALVQELVRLHGGTVQVRSREGHGSTFTVIIPTGTSHLPSDRIQAARTLTSTALGAVPYLEEALRWLPEENQAASELRAELHPQLNPELFTQPSTIQSLTSSSQSPPARILLVDDNADMRNYVKRLLSSHYQVEAVTDGMAALEAMQTELPDLVLTDVMMPRLDGFGLLKALRSDDRTQALPIILLSARAGEEAQIEGLEAGADDYLVKPFSAKELLARVASTLKMAQLRKQAAQREQLLRTEAEAARSQVQNILESISDAFVAFDRDWRYTYVNQAATRLLGRSPDELIGKNVWQEVFPSEVGGLAYTTLHQAVANQVPVSWEEWGQAIQRWLEVHAYPSTDGVALYFRDITDRKRTEAALYQSEERLRVALKNSPLTVFNQDRDLRYTWIYNPTFNFQISDVIGKQDIDLLPSNDAIFVTELKRQVLQTGLGTREEVKVSQPDGDYFYDLTIEPLKNDKCEVVGVTCAAIDITNYKRTEMALRESEERLHSFVVANVIGILYGDVYGGIHEANDEFLRIVGYSREDLEAGQLRWMEITPPEYLPLDEERVAEARARGACTPYEKEYIRKDGSRVPVLLGYGLVGEKREESVAFILDLTERKQAENALRQSEERYRYLAELIPQLVWTADADGVLLDVNQRWLDFTGLTLEQARQAGWEAIIHPDDVPVLSQNWAVAQHNGSYYQAEGRMRQADGGYRWHLHQAVPQKDDRGQVVKWFGTATDIEEQKQLQQERDRSLQQEQAAREEAEAANRIKDEFLAVLSHELRSPLNPILGWAKLLQAGNLDPQAIQRGLEIIERNAKLQTQLIEDLLDVSRILRGKMALTVTAVDLATVIEAAIETVRLSAEAKQIQIQTYVAPNVTPISGDTGRLQQVVWNLLSNAIKFTPARGRVEVKLETIIGDGELGRDTASDDFLPNPHYTQITVSDTGKGISSDFLPYVFDYFRQEDGKITRKFGGLGLGLAIVRHITELHGGTVQVESAGEGKGATFTVRFPLVREESTMPPDEAEIELIRSAEHQADHLRPLAGVRVLVVDDEADMRELATFILEQSGAIVQSAPSASVALSILETFQPSILISDIGMPDVDGYSLMRQVQDRSRQSGQVIPAIALTAYASDYDYQQARQAGFQQHIAKPIAPQDLVEAIAALLKQTSNR